MASRIGYIKAAGVSEILAHFPDIRRISDGVVIEPDIFIVALGFEDRAPSIAEDIARSLKANYLAASRDSTCIMGEYTTNPNDNEKNRKKLVSAVSCFCTRNLSVNADSPHDISKIIYETVEGIYKGTSLRVVFDISAASENFIISVMSGLSGVADKVDLTVIYAEADKYFPTKERFKNDLGTLINDSVIIGDQHVPMEYGVQEVENNELYPGIFQDNYPNYVIAIPTFRIVRAMRCLNSIGEQVVGTPSENVFWVIGRPPSSENRWRAEYLKMVIENMISRVSGVEMKDEAIAKEGMAYCDTLDYKDIITILINQIDTHLHTNITVINMGSKMQAIGVALALYARNEVSVVTARPTQYNAEFYSVGVGDKWCIEFSEFGGILNRLGDISSLSFKTE